MPRGRGWWWALLRLAVAGVLLFLFRFHVLAWLVAGHSVAWRQVTGADHHHYGDLHILKGLRQPGARMLVVLGEAHRLAGITDARVVPWLQRVARTDLRPAVRASALLGLSNTWHEGSVPIYVTALQDPDFRVRRAAVYALREQLLLAQLPALEAAAAVEPDARVAASMQSTIAYFKSVLAGLHGGPDGQDSPPDNETGQD